MSFSAELKDFTGGFKTGFSMAEGARDRELKEAQGAGYNNWQDYNDAGKIRKGGTPGNYDPGNASPTVSNPDAGGGKNPDMNKDQKARAAERYDFLTKDLGYTPQAAAGVLGNAFQESGYDSSLRGGGDAGTAHGEFQWRGDRFTSLKNFASDGDRNGTGAQLDPNDWRTQYRFMKHESDALGVTQAMNAAKTPQQAADIFAMKFERPKGAETGDANNISGISNRRGTAGNIFGQFGGAPAAAPAASTAIPAVAPASKKGFKTEAGDAGDGGDQQAAATPAAPMNEVAEAQPDPAPSFDLASADTTALPDPNKWAQIGVGALRGGAIGLADGGAAAPTAIPTKRVFTQAVDTAPNYTPNATTGWVPRRVGDPAVTGAGTGNTGSDDGDGTPAQQKFRAMLAAQAAKPAADAVDTSRFGHQAYIDAQAAWQGAQKPAAAGQGGQYVIPPQGSFVNNKGDVIPQRVPVQGQAASQPQFMSESQWQAAQPGYSDWYKSTYNKDAPTASKLAKPQQTWLDSYLSSTYPTAGMAAGGPVVGLADGGAADILYDVNGNPIPPQPMTSPKPDPLPPPTPETGPIRGDELREMDESESARAQATRSPPSMADHKAAGTPTPAPAKALPVTGGGPDKAIDDKPENARRRAALPSTHAADKKAEADAAQRLHDRDAAYQKIKPVPGDTSPGSAGEAREIQAKQAAGPPEAEPPAGGPTMGVNDDAESARRQQALASQRPDPNAAGAPTPLPQGSGAPAPPPPQAIPVPARGHVAGPIPAGPATPAPAPPPAQQPSPNLSAAGPPPGTAAPGAGGAAPDTSQITIEDVAATLHRQHPNLPPDQIKRMASETIARLQSHGGVNDPNSSGAPTPLPNGSAGPGPTAIPNPRTPSYNPRTPSAAAPTSAPTPGTTVPPSSVPDPATQLPQSPPGQQLPPPRPPGDANGNLGTPTADTPAPGAKPTSSANPVPRQETQSKPRTAPLVTHSRPTKAPARRPTSVAPASNSGATFNDMTPERPGALIKNPQDYKPGGVGRANAGPQQIQRAALVKPAETQQATKAGMKYINDNILSPARKTAVGADPAQQGAQDSLQRGEHALTQEDYTALAKQVDPEGKLPEAERLLKVQQDMFDFYTARGYPEKAAQASASVLLYGRRVSQLAGVMAQGALAHGDLVGAGNWMHKAYESLPDGKELRIDGQLANEGGKPALHYQIIDLDTGKVEHDDTATAEDMDVMAKSMASSMEWAKQTSRVAQGNPALYRGGGGRGRGSGVPSAGPRANATAENNAKKESARTALNDAGEAYRKDPSDENREAFETAADEAGNIGVAPSAIKFAQTRFGLGPAKAAPTSAGERAKAAADKAAADKVADLNKQAEAEQDPVKKEDLQRQAQVVPMEAAYQQNASTIKRAVPGDKIDNATANLDEDGMKGYTTEDVGQLARILVGGNNIDPTQAVKMANDILAGTAKADAKGNQIKFGSYPAVYVTGDVLAMIQKTRQAAKVAAAGE